MARRGAEVGGSRRRAAHHPLVRLAIEDPYLVLAARVVLGRQNGVADAHRLLGGGRERRDEPAVADGALDQIGRLDLSRVQLHLALCRRQLRCRQLLRAHPLEVRGRVAVRRIAAEALVVVDPAARTERVAEHAPQPLPANRAALPGIEPQAVPEEHERPKQRVGEAAALAVADAPARALGQRHVGRVRGRDPGHCSNTAPNELREEHVHVAFRVQGTGRRCGERGAQVQHPN